MNTKENVAKLAFQLLRKHSSSYSFRWNKRTSAFGTCHHGKQVIFLSELLINRPLEDIKRTLLHELAHEIVRRKYTYAGVKPHGYEWKAEFGNLCHVEGIEMKDSKDYTSITDSRYKYHMVLKGEESISLKKYVRKPNKRTFDNAEHLYLSGKPWTKGQISIITHAEYLNFRTEVA